MKTVVQNRKISIIKIYSNFPQSWFQIPVAPYDIQYIPLHKK